MVQKIRNEKGFTLMELLVVVVILGFLIGMVAPRLASIIDDTVIDNICDSNNKGARYFTKMYYDKTAQLPNEMVSLVNRTGASSFGIPLTEAADSQNLPETLAAEFVERNTPVLHLLNQSEAEELRSMGITQIRYLNDRDGSGHATDTPSQTAQTIPDATRPYEKVTVTTGAAVAMVGMGSEGQSGQEISATAASSINTWTDATSGTYPAGNPNWVGRIILGLGKHCSLVTEGYIQAAALCPGGIQNADNVTFNNYCIIVPRLQSTVDRMDASVADQDFTFVNADDETNGESMDVTIEAQAAWQFDATCPEGHKWPDNDNDYWVID